jgi:hypothetical protein
LKLQNRKELIHFLAKISLIVILLSLQLLTLAYYLFLMKHKNPSDLLDTLATRFEKNMNRHKALHWKEVLVGLEKEPNKLSILQAMEDTGGEPDVVAYDKKKNEYLFFDCAAESPAGRRSLCYDREALDSRKEAKPKNSVLDMAKEIGIELLDEEQYKYLQSLGPIDVKTSSWLLTPSEVRKLGGAIFGDCRFGRVFIYHNGASSYYAARGFRGCVRV